MSGQLQNRYIIFTNVLQINQTLTHTLHELGRLKYSRKLFSWQAGCTDRLYIQSKLHIQIYHRFFPFTKSFLYFEQRPGWFVTVFSEHPDVN